MTTPKTNKVVAELKRIAKENGGLLQPETVVEEARPATSPLHSRFTWDNTEAAHQYRIWQARQLIRVTVEVLAGTEETTEVFVSLTTDRERESGGYRTMVSVLSNRDMRSQLLEDARNDMRLFEEKYAKLTELAEVFSAMKKARQANK
jgi:hypothetical protein